MLVIGIGFCGQATAQEGLASLAKKVKTMRDSLVVKGVDRRYIDVPTIENTQGHNLEVRVKGCANEDSQNKQEEDFDIVSFISYVLHNIFGVRV